MIQWVEATPGTIFYDMSELFMVCNNLYLYYLLQPLDIVVPAFVYVKIDNPQGEIQLQ